MDVWGNKKKALTFSYDDGVIQDIRLINILNKYGMKCTFNINSGCMYKESSWIYKDKPTQRVSKEEAVNIYGEHEIAMHFLTHPRPLEISLEQLDIEINEDIKNLGDLFQCEIVGCAYPYGEYNADVIKQLRISGIKYARTVNMSHNFALPINLFEISPTCKHTDDKLMKLAEEFVNTSCDSPMLFYCWGHSFEFDGDDNWDVIENFCSYMSNQTDIFFGTNREVFGI